MATRKARRLVLTAAVPIFLGATAVLLHYLGQVIAIGVAYKAKSLCSGVFVSGRAPENVLADLEVDDLASLRYISPALDRRTATATATALGLIERRAVYREGLGCTLMFDAGTHPGSHDQQAVRRAAVADQTAAHGALAIASDRVHQERLGAVVDDAFAEQNPLRPKRTRAVVIVHKGRIVAERYAAGIGPDTPLPGWSMTKSVMNALVGILVRDGRLSQAGPVDVDEWRAPGDPRAGITLDQLLRMTSGLQFDENMSRPLADVSFMLLAVADMGAYATNKPLEAAPGTRWRYSSGTTMIISHLIRQALADDSDYLMFPRRALFDRIGMTSPILEIDATGTFVGASLMYATARDWARFGLLYLNDGVWQGERILPEGWVEYTRSPALADSQRRYGAHFWLDLPDEYHASGGKLPLDAFHAAGHEAQFVTIVPSCNAVIVRMGLTRYPDAWDHGAFVRDVLVALGE